MTFLGKGGVVGENKKWEGANVRPKAAPNCAPPVFGAFSNTLVSPFKCLSNILSKNILSSNVLSYQSSDTWATGPFYFGL